MFSFIFQESPWCWCVDRLTGSHITGTSIQNGQPNCEDPANKVSNYNSREWKKCPSEEKDKFQDNLLKYLTYVMKRVTKSTVLNKDETVLKWHFQQLDSNKDGVRKYLARFVSFIFYGWPFELQNKPIGCNCITKLRTKGQ